MNKKKKTNKIIDIKDIKTKIGRCRNCLINIDIKHKYCYKCKYEICYKVDEDDDCNCKKDINVRYKQCYNCQNKLN